MQYDNQLLQLTEVNVAGVILLHVLSWQPVLDTLVQDDNQLLQLVCVKLVILYP